MPSTLRLSKSLSLPIDVITESIAVLGVKGSGKSTSAKKIVEEATKAGQQVVVVDPTGGWWGLASSGDGKSAGLPFTVLGGDHGSLPLSPDAGELIASLAVETNTPLVLDLSAMRKADQRRFMMPFAESLYHLNKEPLLLVVDEVDFAAPQRPVKGAERLLGAMEDIARRGRIKGLGLVAISQRPASVHKDLLSQLSILIAHRLISPQDRNALKSWIDAHGTAEQQADFMDTIASLKKGEAWFWSPSLLDLFERIQIDMPETWDSMKTPKVGEKRIVPKALSPVDIDALRDRLATFVEEIEANDPTVLKRKVRDLETKLAKALANAEPVEVEVPVEVKVEKLIVPDEAKAALNASVRSVEQIGSDFRARAEALAAEASANLVGLHSDLLEQLQVLNSFDGTPPTSVAAHSVARRAQKARSSPGIQNVADKLPANSKVPAARTGPAETPTDADGNEVKLGKPERAFLSVLAQFPDGRRQNQLALLSGYSAKSSSMDKALRNLRNLGFIHENYQPIRITEAGLAVAEYKVLPTGEALYEHWVGKLKKAEREILDVLVEAYPETLTAEDLEARTASNYSATSSSMDKALRTLRTLELAEGSSTSAIAAPDFMAEIG